MKITIKNLQKKVPLGLKTLLLARKAVLKTFERNRIDPRADVALCVLSDRQISKLNARYLSKDNPTDCIAFNLGEDSSGRLIADIAVSAETAKKNSRIFQTSLQYEIILYAVHGALHIAGFDDKNESQRRLMERKAKVIIESIWPSSKQMH